MVVLIGCGRTPGPNDVVVVEDALGLLVTEAPGTVTLEAPDRFRLVFAESHGWQVTHWNDASTGIINLAGDPASPDREVLQQPMLFKIGVSWSLIDKVENATYEVRRLDGDTVELETLFSWRTGDDDLFPGSATHTVSADGLWRVRAKLTNPRPNSVPGFSAEYADTHVRAYLGWTDTGTGEGDTFAFTLDGAEARPRIQVTRQTGPGTIRQDEVGNLYWGSFNVDLDVDETWAQEWVNRIWPPSAE